MNRFTRTTGRARRGGFTLVEIMLVIAIAALVTAITLGGFNSVETSNQRVSCQTNLSQIYQALRLYVDDNNGQFPFYNDSGKLPGPPTSIYYTGIGLWALYTFPCTGAACTGNPGDELAPITDSYPQAPVERYIHDARILHCPADTDATGTLPGATHENMYTIPATDPPTLNKLYLSYQGLDPAYPGATPETYERYQSTRDLTYPAGSCTVLPCYCGMAPCWRHQLTPMVADSTSPTGYLYQSRPPDPTTVVTWCPYHRPSPGSVSAGQFDNVLFYDGTVQVVQQSETNPSSTDTSPLYGSNRVPNPTG